MQMVRVTPHPSTGKSPAELMYGQHTAQGCQRLLIQKYLNFIHSFIYFTQLKNILQILQIVTNKYIY